MDQLKEYAICLTNIRRSIQEKAGEAPVTEVQQVLIPAGKRTKKGLIYSTKSRDAGGKSQKEYCDIERTGKYRIGKMKKRNKKQLDYTELVGIMHEHQVNMRSQKDIASIYHITPSLVGVLLKQYRSGLPIFNQRKTFEDDQINRIQCVELTVHNMLLNNCPIWNSKQIQTIVERDHQL